ncbi:hypothetical protein LD39_17405 [Halobacillus sp. BBL2006]|nr:hypothetical protein LD39_17405 [Halobacillus sp. BBL2006]
MDEITIDVDTKFLTKKVLQSMTVFGKDEDREIVNTEGEIISLKPNTLIDPHLIQKYERAWQNY